MCYIDTITYCAFIVSIAMDDLIRLVHRNTAGLQCLVRCFREYWGKKKAAENPLLLDHDYCTNGSKNYEELSCISKKKLEEKITKIAIKQSRAPDFKPRYFVHDTVLQQYQLTELSIDQLPQSTPLTAMLPSLNCETPKRKRSHPPLQTGERSVKIPSSYLFPERTDIELPPEKKTKL